MSNTLTTTRASSHSITSAFVGNGSKKRYVFLVSGLILLAVLITLGVFGYKNPMPIGSAGYWRIASMRGSALLVIALVAICHSFATVSFQTITNNRILTPSIMGFESLYVALQTSIAYFFGLSGLSALTGTTQYFLQIILMVVVSGALYGWLLRGKNGNMHIMLLIGIVLGTGLASISTFMQRFLDPGTFDVLTAKLFGNISNAHMEYLVYSLPIVIICVLVLYLRAGTLNVLALGKDTATNLGINVARENIFMLLIISILMAVTTALVGPMTFLGFLAATLAYQLTNTYDHRLIFPIAAFVGYCVLGGAYFVMRNIFYADGAVTIVIELIGGSVFLYSIMRKGRL